MRYINRVCQEVALELTKIGLTETPRGKGKPGRTKRTRLDETEADRPMTEALETARDYLKGAHGIEVTEEDIENAVERTIGHQYAMSSEAGENGEIEQWAMFKADAVRTRVAYECHKAGLPHKTSEQIFRAIAELEDRLPRRSPGEWEAKLRPLDAIAHPAGDGGGGAQRPPSYGGIHQL